MKAKERQEDKGMEQIVQMEGNKDMKRKETEGDNEKRRNEKVRGKREKIGRKYWK